MSSRTEEQVRELITAQAALRQVATLVAREATPDQFFAVVAEQVAQIFDVPYVGLVRYEPYGSVVVGCFSGADHEPPTPISRNTFPTRTPRRCRAPGVAA